jgi:hypothetical protein
VVFIRQSNGFADLWGACLEDVAGYELGELEECSPNLFQFVRDCK